MATKSISEEKVTRIKSKMLKCMRSHTTMPDGWQQWDCRKTQAFKLDMLQANRLTSKSTQKQTAASHQALKKYYLCDCHE